jgi:hypothetical protein
MTSIDPLQNQMQNTEIASIELKMLDESDIINNANKNIVHSGYNIEIALPLAKTSNDAIFGINLDGFVPSIDFDGKVFSQLNRNLATVQVTKAALDYTKVFYTPVPHEIISKFLTYRNVQGNVNVILRSTANVGQSGNCIISQVSGVGRYLYHKEAGYNGLVFSNSTTNSINTMQAGTVVWDLSLSRNVSITTKFRNPLPAVDIMQKMWQVVNTPVNPNLFNSTAFYSQFAENWLLITPQNSLPDTQGNTLNIAVYFDYSQLVFSNPGIPLLASPSNNRYAQILKWSETFNAQPDIPIVTKEEWLTKLKWLPGPPGKKEKGEKASMEIVSQPKIPTELI